MLLGEIRNYLQQRGSASLGDVATHFDIAPDTARFALDYWQQRGKVRAVNAACGSGGCGGKSCGGGDGTHYEWRAQDIPLQFTPFSRTRT